MRYCALLCGMEHQPHSEASAIASPGDSPPPEPPMRDMRLSALKRLNACAPKVVDAIVAVATDPKHRDHVKAACYVLDRVYGKVPDRVQHTGADGGVITIAALRDLTDDELLSRAATILAQQAKPVLP